MKRLSNTSLEGQQVLVSEKGDGYWALGPDLTLAQCGVRFEIGMRAFSVTRTVFMGCDLQAKTPLRGVRWHDCTIERCRFGGTLIGNHFGKWPSKFGPSGGLIESDFSAARLQDTRFFNIDPSGITFPKWPCFVVVLTPERRQELLESRAPGDLRFWFDALASQPNEVSAVADYAPAVQKRWKVSESELRTSLAQLGLSLD